MASACTDQNYYRTCGNCHALLMLCACGWHKQVPPNRNPPPPPPRYNNSDLCGECTGAGCKQCYDGLGLRRLGSETFPLSHAVSGCVPSRITKPATVWKTQ